MWFFDYRREKMLTFCSSVSRAFSLWTFLRICCFGEKGSIFFCFYVPVKVLQALLSLSPPVVLYLALSVSGGRGCCCWDTQTFMESWRRMFAWDAFRRAKLWFSTGQNLRVKKEQITWQTPAHTCLQENVQWQDPVAPVSASLWAGATSQPALNPSSCSVLAHVQLSTSGGQKKREQLVLYSERVNQWCCRTSSYSLFYINSHNQYTSNRSSGQRNVLPAARNHSQGCLSSPEPQLEMGHCCRMAQSEGNERCWCRMNTPEQDCCCASLFWGLAQPCHWWEQHWGLPWAVLCCLVTLCVVAGAGIAVVAIFSVPAPHPVWCTRLSCFALVLLHPHRARTSDHCIKHTHGKCSFK